MPTVGSLAWSLISNASGFLAGTEKARKGARGLKAELNSLKAGVARLDSVFTTLGVTITGAAIVGGIRELVSHSFEAIDTTAKLSDRLGVATEKLTGLRHSASLAGVEASQFDADFEQMVKRLAELTAKGGADADLLKRMGLDPRALGSQSPDQAFLAIADAISKMESPLDRAAAATKLFGRQGQDLLNTLMQGSDAIREQIDEAERLGVAFSRVDAAIIEEANDAWDRMGTAIEGASNKISVLLAPIIEEAAQGIERLVTGAEDLDKENRSQSQQQLIDDATSQSWFQGLFVANDIDRRNKQFEWLQNLENVPDVTPEQIAAADAPKTSLVDQIANERAMEAKAKADERSRHAIQDRELAMAMDAQRERERREEELADRVQEMFDKLQTPAERLAAEFKELAALQPHLDSGTFGRGLADLEQRAAALAGGGPAGTQSTAAIRAGSIDALRAQFSGNIAQKSLEAAKKTAEETSRAAGVLEEIRDKITNISEAPG